MTYITRRKFIGASSLLMAAPFIPSILDAKKYKPKLAFSTLGCPDWTFKEITDFAKKNNYQGIELRGIKREMDLPKSPVFNSAANMSATLAMMRDKNLKFVDLGSSCSLHFADPAVRRKNLDEGRRFIDLAAKIDCPNVRVFPNNIPKDQDRDKTFDLITAGLVELGEYAKGGNVSVLLETHGDLAKTDDIVRVMKDASGPHTGLVWDIANMWEVTREPPEMVYPKLKKYIKHTHIKDLKVGSGKIEYALFGQGDVPAFAAIDLLAKDRFEGYYSFEWEKLWHPEIAEPEIAIADFSKVMIKHFS